MIARLLAHFGHQHFAERPLCAISGRSYSANDILEITDAPGQAINSGDHQDVTSTKKIQHRLKLGPAGRCGSAALLSANDATPRRLECGYLNFEVLVVRAYTRIANDGHRLLRLSHLVLDYETMPYQKSEDY
jgi:hypothetical protein